MLPHLAGRPVTLVRFPNGVTGESFFEKRCPAHAPGLGADRRRRRPGRRCVVDDVPTLVWLANLAALELHTLQARADVPTGPRPWSFDLDPGAPADVLACCAVALELRDAAGPARAGQRGEDVGLQGPAPRGAGAGRHRRRHEGVRPGTRAAARRPAPRAGHRRDGQGRSAATGSSSTGARTTATRPRSARTRCGPSRSRWCRPRCPGTRSPTRSTGATRARSASRRPRCSRGRAARGPLRRQRRGRPGAAPARLSPRHRGTAVAIP